LCTFKEKQEKGNSNPEGGIDASCGAKKTLIISDIIPFKKSKNKGGTLTKRVGDTSCGAEKTINSLARLFL
jgi:hypothetical protein